MKYASYLVTSHKVTLSDAVSYGVISEREAEFFTQSRDMYPYRITECIHAVVPNMLYKLLLADRSALINHEIFQNSRFLTGEVQHFFVNRCSPCFGIKGKLSAGQQYVVLGELLRG